MAQDTKDLVNELSPLLTARGLDLIDIERKGAELTVFVDHEGGVTLDELGQATRAIVSRTPSTKLDPISGPLHLPRCRAPGSSGACACRPTSPAPSARPSRSASTAARTRCAGSRGRSSRLTIPAWWWAVSASPTTRSSGPAPSSSGARHPSRRPTAPRHPRHTHGHELHADDEGEDGVSEQRIRLFLRSSTPWARLPGTREFRWRRCSTPSPTRCSPPASAALTRPRRPSSPSTPTRGRSASTARS